MGAPPAPVVRKGAGMGLIVGLVLGALVLAAGGYFGYKKFFGPKEPSQDAAQVQTQVDPAQPATSTPAEQPPAEVAQSQPPANSGGGQNVLPRENQPAPAVRPSMPGPAQNVGTKPPSASPQQKQAPVYTPPPAQPSTPAYTPPAQPSAPVSRPSAQPAAQPQERSFPPAPVTQTPPQAAAPSVSTPAASSASRYTGPTSGMLMWLGKLDKNGVVTIEGNHASAGTLTGALPGVPVTLETDLTNIGFAEMPGPSNGWKKVSLRSKKSQNIVISIRWKVLN